MASVIDAHDRDLGADLSYAAPSMRGLIIDYAGSRHAAKRGTAERTVQRKWGARSACL